MSSSQFMPPLSNQINDLSLNKIDFKINKKLSDSTYGTIFLAFWHHNGESKKVVLKSQHSDASHMRNENIIMQFIQEKRIPNTVLYYGYGHISGTDSYDMVMKYYEYGSLRDCFKTRSIEEFSLPVRIQMAIDITQAVATLHKYQVVHRDIKSPNVLVDANKQAKLCDFGLASALRNNEATSAGSLYWMAPELFTGHPYTYAAESYSLAILYHELMKWNTPYSDERKTGEVAGQESLLMFFAEKKHQSIPENCPENIKNAIQEGWDYEPKKRPLASKLLSFLTNNNTQSPTADNHVEKNKECNII